MEHGMDEVLNLIKGHVLYKHPLVLVEEVEKMLAEAPMLVPTVDEYKDFYSANRKTLRTLGVIREDQMLISKPSYLDNLLRTILNNAIEAATLAAKNVRLIPIRAETYLGLVPMVRAAYQHAKEPAAQPHLSGIGEVSREFIDGVSTLEEGLAIKRRQEKLDKDVPPLYDKDGKFIDKNLYNRYRHQK